MISFYDILIGAKIHSVILEGSQVLMASLIDNGTYTHYYYLLWHLVAGLTYSGS